MVEKKVALVLGPDPSSKGGIASVVSVYLQSTLPQNFNLEYLATTTDGTRLTKLVRGFKTLCRVTRLLFSGRVSVLHVHSASYISFLRKAVFLGLARVARVPTVLHIHGAEFEKFVDQKASSLVRAFVLYSMRNVDRIVALSGRWQDYFHLLAPNVKIVVIANPVRVPPKWRMGMEEHGRLLFLGRAEQRKGIFDLIDALCLVREKVPSAKLVICGDGDLELVRQAAQRAGVADSVEILGWIRGSDKETQLHRAQVFVLPSYDEGLPVSMLEAMAYGKAIAVSAVGGIPEAVSHLTHGVLLEPGQPSDMADHLVRLLENQELREKLGSAARARVEECFSEEAVIAQVSQLYAELGVGKRAMALDRNPA